MASEGAVTAGQLLEIARRRYVMILVLAVAGTALAALISLFVSDVYEARSVVTIEPARMPQSQRNPGLLGTRLSQLVGLLRQEVLARDTLRDLVSELDLYGPASRGPASPTATGEPEIGFFQRLSFVDPVERARKDLKIDIVKRFGEDFVEISVRARGAELSARAVNRVADILASKNHELRIRQEQDGKAFLEDQLVRAERRREDAEAALSRFRETNQESLPENAGALLDRLSKLRSGVEENKERIAKAEREIAAVSGAITSLISSGGSGGPEGERALIEQELKRSEAEALDLASRGYGAGWPALARARLNAERARERLAELIAAPEAASSSPEREPLVKTASARAPLDEKAVEEALASRGAAADVVARARALLAHGAGQASLVASLERDLEGAVSEASRLDVVRSSLGTTRVRLEKLEAAYDQAAAEHRALENDLRDMEKLLAAEQAGRTEQFRTIEAAEAPFVPAAPNRPLIVLAALLGSLGAAFVLACALELRAGTYKTLSDVEEDLGVPVLAVLPLLPAATFEASEGGAQAATDIPSGGSAGG